ncbi:MAG: type II toxin-antitoxin system Phd/YefM family antitoxin [Elusimicrobiota bacterium]
MAYQTIPATTLRNHLADALKALAGTKKFLLITKKQRPVSAIVDIEFFEDLLAAASPEYLKSIREAREDYTRGRVFSHQDVFGKL